MNEPSYRICPNCNGDGFVHNHEGVLLGTCMECVDWQGMVRDSRLQAIADAWQRVDYPGRHIIRKAAGELVAVVEDALGGTDNE